MEPDLFQAIVLGAAAMVAMIPLIATLSDITERRYAKKERTRVEGEFYKSDIGEADSEEAEGSGEANNRLDTVGRDREGSGRSNGSKESGSDYFYVAEQGRVFPIRSRARSELDPRFVLLLDYYTQSLAQFKAARRMSLFFGSFGSAILLGGTALAVVRAETSGPQYAAIVVAVGGTVITVVSGALFA